MYVCICNALKDRQLKAAARGDGACAHGPTGVAMTVADVFKRCGSRPQCGRCLPDVATMIDEAHAENSAPENQMPLAAE